MGLVKFGAQTLNIDNVGDGHIIIPESEYNTMRQAKNSFDGLKNRIPAGVNELDLQTLIEKGQRYDSTLQELTTTKDKLSKSDEKLRTATNLPEGFSVDKWNSYTKAEQDAIRKGKLDALTKTVIEEAEKKAGVKISVDERFYDAQKVAAFNPDAPDAKEQWNKITESAYDAQLDFLRKQSTSPTQSTAPKSNVEGAEKKLNDTVSDSNIQVARL